MKKGPAHVSKIIKIKDQERDLELHYQKLGTVKNVT